MAKPHSTPAAAGKTAAKNTAWKEVVDLLTGAERRLFEASRDSSLARATAAELGKSIALARALRDKWRDRFRSQRRAGQTAARARGVEGNDRSRHKSELFADVLGRFEGRLAELKTTVATALAAKRKASTRPSRPARTAANRTERARVRASLAGLSTAGPVNRPAKGKAGRATIAASAVPRKRVKRSTRSRAAGG